MKTSVVRFFAGSGIRLAVLSVLFLGMAGVCMAQAIGASAQPNTNAVAPAAAPQNASQTTRAAQPAASAERQPGGTHEGIKVHGHWMIEVREPNGKLISHTEFENMLYPAGGGTLLPLILGGAYGGTYVPGEWGVLLGDPASPPCAARLAQYAFNDSQVQSTLSSGPVLAFSTPFCVLTPQAPPAEIYPLNCGTSIPNSDCSYNLSLGGTTVSLTLTGSVISSSAGTISQVQTLLSTCSFLDTPNACVTETTPAFPVPPGIYRVFAFTAATLPQGPPPGMAPNLCGETGQVSCAVTVPAAGDTINVQVTISFQ